MSEWFKEHDWKSCVRLKRTGGSNPLLCAKQKDFGCSPRFFFCVISVHTIFTAICKEYKTRLKMGIYAEFFKLFSLEIVHYVRVDV